MATAIGILEILAEMWDGRGQKSYRAARTMAVLLLTGFWQVSESWVVWHEEESSSLEQPEARLVRSMALAKRDLAAATEAF